MVTIGTIASTGDYAPVRRARLAWLRAIVRAVGPALKLWRRQRRTRIHLSHLTEAQLERIRQVLERECGDDVTHKLAIERLIERR